MDAGIREEYRQIFGEEPDEKFLNELLAKYSPEEARRLLGITVAAGKRLSRLRSPEDGSYVRIFVYKKRDERTVKDGKLIKIYLVGDEETVAVLTLRSGRSLEPGHRYIVGPIRIRHNNVNVGNATTREIYVYDDADLVPIEYRKEPVELEEFEIDPRPFAKRPFIGYITGTVVSLSKNFATILTDFGEVRVRLPGFARLSRGDKIRLGPVYGPYLEASRLLKVEVLGKSEAPQAAQKIRGIVADIVRKSGRRGTYYIYVLYDGKGLVKAFHRSESPLSLNVGDLAEFEVSEAAKGYSVEALRNSEAGEKRTVSGSVKSVRAVSDFSPKFLVELENAKILTDRKPEEGSVETFTVVGRELDGVFVGRELEEQEIATVIDVEFDGSRSRVTLHDGVSEYEVTLEGDLTELEGRDVIVERDETGKIVGLKPIRTFPF